MSKAEVTTTRLLFARHGETDASHSSVFSGTLEAMLTDVGRWQAQQLANRLRSEPIDALYSSPQQRAIDTATPIAEATERAIQIRAALREMDFGYWEGLRRVDFAAEYPRELDLWNRGSWLAYAPGGETQQDVISRAARCMMEIVNAHEGQTVVIVAHRTLLRLLIGHMLDMPLSASRSLSLSTASLSELHINDGRVELQYYNDTRHLATGTAPLP